MTAASRRSGERGQVLALVALAIVAIFAVAALVLDIGRLRIDRRVNKNTADAAARAGVGRLQFGPWSGVCKAREFLLVNTRAFSAFDPGSETWSNAASPPAAYGTSPCPTTLTGPDATPCSPNAPATWAVLRATAGGGRFTIEIASGYALPDARFPEDGAQSADTGNSDQGSCDNLSVIITQRRAYNLAQAAGFTEATTRVRSVARLNSTETIDYVAALHLLEQHKCGVLQTGGTNTRVVAQPIGDHPGIIQIDSADDAGSCAQPILNAQATSAGPSVIACSAVSSLADCQAGTGSRVSRVGVYALNFTRPAGDIATAFPTTYGDTKAVATPRSGRRFADKAYRANIAALDAEAKSVITANSGRPPGCATVLLNSCTGNGVTWLVLEPTDCTNLAAFFLVGTRTAAQNIWFHCDLDVGSALTLIAPNATIVVTGSLSVRSTFTIVDPRTFFVGGKATGNRVGSDSGGAGSILNVNTGVAGTAACKTRVGAGHATRMVVGDGSFGVTSGAEVHLCQTLLYLASGFDKVPTSDGTPPCTTPCSGYDGTISVSSNSVLDWSAPNEITGRHPEPLELATTNKYEDLALWTEAGGTANGITGGGATSLSGVFFLPNADSFNLAGGGALPIYLSAQFISTSLKVTGGATVNLTPTPTDSVAVTIYSTLLVR